MLRKIYSRYGKNKQFYRHLSSYAIVMLLAVMVNLIGYGTTLRVLEREVEKNNANAVANIQVTCDGFFSELLSSTYGLLRSSSVQQVSREKLSDYERLKYINDVQHDMGNIIGYSGVEDCAVILRNSDMCIQNFFGIVNLKMAYKNYYSRFYGSQDLWLDGMFSVSGAEFLAVTPNGKNISYSETQEEATDEDTKIQGNASSDDTQVFLVYRIPNVNAQLAVAVKLDSRQMADKLSGGRNSSEQTFIVNENGDVIFGSANRMKIDSLNGIENGMHSFNGTEYMVSVVDSENTSFRYVRMINSALYSKQVKRVRNSFVLGYFLCVLLAGGLSWWFTELNERRKRRIEAELLEQRKYLRQNIVRQAIRGEFKSWNEIPDGYKELFVSKRFVVLLFDVLPLTADEEESENASVDYEILRKYLSARFAGDGSEYSAEFCVIDEMCAGILQQPDGKEDFNEISSIVEKICISLGAELNMDMHCAVSSAAENICDLQRAYKQALEIINLRFLGENKNVFVYDDVLQTAPRYEFTSELGERLIDILLLGDYQGAKRLINEQFDFSHTEQRMSLGLLRMVTAEMIQILLKAAARIDEDGEIDCKQLYMSAMHLNNLQQLNEIRKSILQYAEKLCEKSGKNVPEKFGHKYQKIEEYVQKNYMDPKLNVNMLADVFQMNRSWLSKTFREKVGVSISDYIIKCRLDKAKELLKTDMTVAQIAQATGFSDTGLYCRAFKKYEGITSMQYRQLLGVNQQEDEDGENYDI